MKNIAKQILIFTMIVLGATGAWAQTLSDEQPQQTNGSWTFTMPAGNRTLRTTWKQEIGLAWKIEEQTVYNASGYLHFRSLATLPVLYIPTNITDFGTKGKYGSSNQSVATIDNSGNVSFVGVGETTIYAVYNDVNYYDSVYYTLTIGTPYTLTLGVNNSEWGDVALTPISGRIIDNGNSTYKVYPNTEVTVTATANPLHFVNDWEDELHHTLATATYSNYAVTSPENKFPSNSTLTLTMTGDTTTKALFGINDYVVRASVAEGQNERGTVKIAYTDGNGNPQTTTPGTSVEATALGGSQSTVTATPAYGYVFNSWDDNVTSNQRTTTSAANYTANFGFDQFTVSAVVADGQNAMGSVSGDATVDYLSNVTLTATYNPGYHFVNWTNAAGTVLGTETSVTVQALRDSVITAHFAENPTLTLVADGNGTVTLATPLPNGVFAIENDPQSGAKRYSVPPGTNVYVTATPGEHYYVQKRSINTHEVNVLSNVAICRLFSIDETTTITFHFVAKPILTLAANPTDGGSVGFESEMSSTLDLSTVSSDITVSNGTILTGTLGTKVKVSIADGATVTLDGMSINANKEWTDGNFAGLTCLGNATIVLADGSTNTVKGCNYSYPGIQAGGTGKTLVIKGTGSLTAATGQGYGTNGLMKNGAGIGSRYNNYCGNIVIYGGNITATGGDQSAGIGGSLSSCGTITINGGTITATGGKWGPGIGGGGDYNDIIINGGNINATGGENAAGIGSRRNGSCGNITILGGTVEATGGQDAPGIGSGYAYYQSASCGAITIGSDVTSVTATKGSGATNSIGAGNFYSTTNTCGTVTIGGTEGVITQSPYTYNGTGAGTTISTLPTGIVAGSSANTYIVDYGTDVFINANANTKYHVESWSNNVDVDNIHVANQTFTMTTDASITANFAENPTLTLVADGNGTVTLPTSLPSGVVNNGNGVYSIPPGTQVTVTATPAEHHYMQKWTVGNNVNTKNSNAVVDTTFTVTETMTLTATFAANTYTITAQSANETMGTASGTETVDYLTNVTLTATANYGYHFVNWTNAAGTVLGTETSLTVQALRDSVITANFTYNTYTVTAQSANETMGSASGTATVNYLSTVTLTATPNYGYHFVNWTNAAGTVLGTETTVTVQALRDSTITANFAANTYTITAQSANSTMGTASGTATVNYLSTVTLTATPNYGYHFVNWTNEAGAVLGTETSLTVQALRDSVITANFTYNQYTVTAQSANETMGSASGTATVNYLTNVTLTATPNYGYHFVNWTNAAGTVLGTETSLTVQALRDSVITANFTYNTYTVTAQSANETMGSASGTATVNYLSTVTLTATPNYGYHFVNWTNAAGTVLGIETSLTVQALRDSMVYAVFDTNTYVLTVLSDNEVMGSVNGSTTAAKHFLNYQISATANEGYHFMQWNDGNSDNPRTVTLTQAATYTATFDTNTYALTVVVADGQSGWGSVAGSTTAKHFKSYQISATANEGYHFVQWNDGNSDNPRTVTLTQATTYTATFDTNTYALTVVVADGQSGWGSVAGSTTAKHFKSYQISATANEGYHFVQWNDNNTDNPRTLTVTKDSSFTASFAIDTYTLNLVANGNGTVVLPEPLPAGVTGSNGTYTVNHGTQVTVTATPADYHYMQKWTVGNNVNIKNSNTTVDTTFTVNTNTTLTAYFAQKPILTLSTNPSDPIRGYVTIAGTTLPNYVAQIGTSSSYYVDYDSSVTVKATPIDHYHLASWNNIGGNELQQVVTMTSDMEITGVFAIDTFTLTLQTNDINKGYVEVTNHNGNPAIASHDPDADGTRTYKVNYGAEVIIKATPEDHYHLESWSNGATVNTEDTIHVNVTKDSTVTANFAINTYTIAATVSPTNSGSVNGAGTYNHGETATLTAIPATGYHFVNWTKGGTPVCTTATYTFTVTNDSSFVANFAINSYTIAASVSPANSGSVNGAGSYNHGATATLTAIPATGYHFVNWTKGGTPVCTTATYTFTVTNDSSFVANFAINTYTIAATVSPENSGSVNGAGSYNHGATATLTAIPATGYHFVNWTKGGTPVCTTATYSFTVTNDSSFVANFAINTYTIAATVSPENSGSVNGAGSYNHGETATLTAIPATGYHFVNWTKGGTPVCTTATYSFTVTNDSSFVANFAINTYTLTLTPDGEGTVTTVLPADGVTSNGNGTYTVNYGTTVTVNATAAQLHHVAGWSDEEQNNLSAVATYSDYAVTNPDRFPAKSSINVTVTGDTTMMATFGINSYEVNASVANTTDVRGTVKIDYTDANNQPQTTGAAATVQATALGGSTTTLIAIPAAGYHFVNWTNGNAVLGTNDTLTTTEALTAIANFDTTHANLAWSAEEFTGYVAIDFNNWKPTLSNPNSVNVRYGCVEGNDPDNGGIAVDASTGTIGDEMNFGHATLKSGTFHIYAVHETDQGHYYDSVVYTLHVLPSAFVGLTPNIPEAGTVSMPNATNVPSLTHHYATVGNLPTVIMALNESVDILAEPATGYHFNYWQIPLVPQEEATTAAYTYQFTIPIAVNFQINLLTRTLRAIFDTNTYALNVVSANLEMGSGNGGNLAAKHFLNYEISASPNTGYHFVKWNDGNTANPRTVTLISDSTFTAIFAPDTFTITYMDGETELNVDTFYYHQPITDYTVSKVGWDFLGWSPEVPEVMPAGNLTVYAQWYRICDSVTDVDHNTYPSVNINNKCWMAANLRTTHYADGRDITNLYEYTSFLYPNTAENVSIYGRLYDWYDAMDATRPAKAVRVQGICPAGWRMPTQEDFAALDTTDLLNMRSTNFWVVNDGTNSTGFDMRGSGMYNIDNARYEELLCKAYFWTANGTSATEAHCREASYFCNTFLDLIRNKENAFSVRCVKD